MGMGHDSSLRRAPRLAVRVEGRLSGRTPRAITVLDLSLTGCLARGDAPLEPGTILDLELALPEGPLTAKVSVAESSLDGTADSSAPRWLVGLQFLNLTAHEHDRLRRLLDAERRRRRGADKTPR